MGGSLARRLLLAAALVSAGLMTAGGTVGMTVFYAQLVGGGVQFGGDPDGSGLARLTIQPEFEEICWEISADGIESASWIGIVNAGGAAVVQLDTTSSEGRYQGCRTVPSDSLDPIVTDPGAYRLRVETATYPLGAIVGPLESFVVTERVHVALYLCPPGVRTLEDATAAGGLFVACAAAALPGDVPPAPVGFHYATDPVELDLDLRLEESDGLERTLADALPSGGGLGDGWCVPSLKSCALSFDYAFYDVLAGDTTAVQATLPEGYAFGSARVGIGLAPIAADVDPIARTISFELTGDEGGVAILFIATRRPSIVRHAGADRYATAAAVSKGAFGAGVPIAYVATGANFPDALGAGPAAAALGGPVLLVTRDAIPAVTATELARLKPAKIVVVGGTSVVGNAVQTSLEALFD